MHEANSSLSSDVALLGQVISHEYEEFWQDVCNSAPGAEFQDSFYEPSFGKVDEGQYYNMARLFAYQHGRDAEYARSIANYEIHKNLGPTSAEYKLLGAPDSSELLLHAFSIYYDEPFENTIKRTEYAPAQPIYGIMQIEHQAMQQFHENDPEMFWRLVLTRTAAHHGSIREVEAKSLEFLDRLTDGSETFLSEKQQESIGESNMKRAALCDLKASMIEQLARDGVEPVRPSEYFELLQRYFAGLIKNDEDRLNPYSADSGSHPALPGEVALRAFFERTE